jgi:hypothetical protein
LFLAVVNQAICNVLENGKEAKQAVRWRLSEDFDALDKLVACRAKPGLRKRYVLPHPIEAAQALPARTSEHENL